VKPRSRLDPCTGPISPLQNTPATGTPVEMCAILCVCVCVCARERERERERKREREIERDRERASEREREHACVHDYVVRPGVVMCEAVTDNIILNP
jgi:hypothetical protein